MHKRNLGYHLLIGILVTIMIGSSALVVKELYKYKKGTDLYKKISEDYVEDDGENTTPTEDDDQLITPPQIDHAGLAAQNSDYIGWLRIEACNIDYPVVIGKTNDDYIHTGFNKEYVYAGTLFVDYENQRDFSDPNTILYGHNMRNRSMFGNLRNFLDSDFATTNHSFWLCTKDYSYLYEIYSIAVVRVEGSAFTLFSKFDEKYAEYVSERVQGSAITIGITPDEEARTLTLSTCYGPGVNGNRLIIQAYRSGAYPSEGCTQTQAEWNERSLRVREDKIREARLKKEAKKKKAKSAVEESYE